jgi:hypothetical protein
LPSDPLLDDLQTALDAVLSSEAESAEELLRDAMHRMVAVAQKHESILEKAIQENNNAYLSNLGMKLLPRLYELLGRLKKSEQIRPVPDPILGRTVMAMLIGFVLSERVVPQVGRMLMRVLPQKAWLDGLIDLMLYGILEDDAR